MAIIISEVVYTSDNKIAVEFHNNGTEDFSTASSGMVLGNSSTNLNLGLSGATVIPAGGFIVIGHSEIPGVDFSSNDANFVLPNLSFVMWNSNDSTNDHVGSNGSTNAIPPDSVVETPDFNRAPDPDINTNNLSLFTVSSGASNNSLGTFCFGAGTMIATPTGEVRVDSLAIGDPILTSDGRIVPVMWIGLQTVHKLRAGRRMEPVRIRAGAWSDGLPHSDLIVTADHGMVIDGLVINASALVNGAGIDWVPMEELDNRITYYHIETETHEVILANGLPAETFIDYAGRRAFDNYAEYQELSGAERIIPEMDHLRISARRLLPDAIKARFGIEDQADFCDRPLRA